MPKNLNNREKVVTSLPNGGNDDGKKCNEIDWNCPKVEGFFSRFNKGGINPFWLDTRMGGKGMKRRG